MGRGSRHSKNAGTMGSEAMTYGEMKGLGYGTVLERLGKVSVPLLICDGLRALEEFCSQILTPYLSSQDAVGNYYDCRLTLQPAMVSGELVVLIPDL